MKIFGYSRKGFLYIDKGSVLISQQTTSSEESMRDNYISLPEFKDFGEAHSSWVQAKNKISGIDRNFQEDMIDAMDMGQDETIERTYY